MNTIKRIFFVAASAAILFTACKKEEDTVVDTNEGTVEVVFVPMSGSNALKMNEPITTPAGEELTIQDMKFFISNVAMVQKDAKEVSVKPLEGDSCQNGIWLINLTNPNHDAGYGQQAYKVRFTAPAGDYADLRFSVEVPREYNLADITKNPHPVNGSNGMYWSWNSGFKFFVINGKSPVVGPSGRDQVHLSIGQGFRSVDYNFRSMLLAAERPGILVEKGKTTTMVFTYDVNKLLTNVDGTPYSLVSNPGGPSKSQVHGGEMSSVLQQNSASAIDLLNFFINQ